VSSKFSQIAPAGAAPALTDQALGLTGGTVDNLFTLSQLFAAACGAAPTAVGALNIATGTITASTPVLNLTQTWNAGGVTFTGLKLNVINTASAVGSKMLDVQVGGTSVFTVGRGGPTANSIADSRVVIGPGPGYSQGNVLTILDPGGSIGWSFGSTNNNGFTVFNTGNGGSTISSQGWFTANLADTLTAAGYQWAHSGQGADAQLGRDGAGIIGLINITTLTNPRTLRVYNTTDSGVANYERGVFDWTTTTNVLTIGTQNAGTGSARDLHLTAASGKYLLENHGASCILYFEDGNGFIQRTAAGNSFSIAPSGATIALNVSLAQSQFGAFGGSYAITGCGQGAANVFTITGLDQGGNAGAGNAILLRGGGGSTATTGNVGGSASLQGGPAGGSGNNVGGDVLLDGGAKTGSGTDGNINVGSARGQIILNPAASVTPTVNGQLMFQATSNTSLTFKYKGSDGTVRSASLTLA
jgi:hypothetical protein